MPDNGVAILQYSWTTYLPPGAALVAWAVSVVFLIGLFVVAGLHHKERADATGDWLSRVLAVMCVVSVLTSVGCTVASSAARDFDTTRVDSTIIPDGWNADPEHYRLPTKKGRSSTFSVKAIMNPEVHKDCTAKTVVVHHRDLWSRIKSGEVDIECPLAPQ